MRFLNFGFIGNFKTFFFPKKKILFESQTKTLVGLFVLFLLFCFPLLKLQVFSQSFALTGEDQPQSSLLATMWDWKGEVAVGSAAAVILYLCNNTPGWGRVHNMPSSSSCKHCSTISDLTPEWAISNFYSLCWFLSPVNKKWWMASIQVPVLTYCVSFQACHYKKTAFLYPVSFFSDEWSERSSWVLLTSAADT